MDTFFKIIRTAVSILTALMVTGSAVVMLLGFALFIWVGVAITSKFIESNQNDDVVIKEDAPVIKEDVPVIKMFMKRDGVFVPLQNYIDEIPEDIVDKPNDSAITKAIKSSKREEYNRNLFTEKEFCIEFKYKDSYIKKAKKHDIDDLSNPYIVELDLPEQVAYIKNNRSELIDWRTFLNPTIVLANSSDKLGIVSFIEKNYTEVSLILSESDMNKILKDGNTIRITATLYGYIVSNITIVNLTLISVEVK